MSTLSPSPWTTLASLSGASAVMLGAFGSHGLKNRVSDPSKIASWGTAAQYHLIHSVVLLVADQAFPSPRSRAALWAKGLLTAGIVMFSGSIYGLVLDEGKKVSKVLGPVTPLGGLCLIGGWVAMGVASRGRGLKV